MSRVACLNDPGDASSHMGCVDVTGNCEGLGKLEKAGVNFLLYSQQSLSIFVRNWMVYTIFKLWNLL